MSPPEAVVLGVVQGLTEFLPVSSSGHLVVFQRILGMHEPELFFDVCVHLGTLLAVCVFVRRELARILGDVAGLVRSGGLRAAYEPRRVPSIRLLILLLAATAATACVAVAFRGLFEGLFAAPRAVGAALLGTAGVLFLTRCQGPGRRR